MAKIIPFKAVRPTRDKVSLVTCRSYDEYSPAELASQLDFNPLSFLHILNPAYTNPQSRETDYRFNQVRQKYQEFKEDNILKVDETPAMYIHRIVGKDRTFTGIIAATSIQDYKSDIIKKHENTLAYRTRFFKDYMKVAGFNTEPVLLTYPDNPLIGKFVRAKTIAVPEYEFSTSRNELHALWKIDHKDDVVLLQNIFKGITKLYIADGHHRSASAEMLYDEIQPAESDCKSYFMSFLISESNVKIYEFNRLVRDLNGNTKEELLEKLSETFIIEEKSGQFHPIEKHQMGMYLDFQFYSLILKDEWRHFNSALESLDAQILFERVLSPILGIEDLRNDARIKYIPGKLPLTVIKNHIDSGEFEIGFTLFPSDINEVKAIADANLIMPPKSTYIEPKFRSGLVVYEL